MSFGKEFEADFALNLDKDSIGYNMYVYKDMTGNSLIADTEKELNFLKNELKKSYDVGKAYNMSDDEIGGMQQALQEKINDRQKAINTMKSAKTEYEKYTRQAGIGNYKANKLRGNWL